MSVPVITFFNNKGGVGKTSLVYHMAWLESRMGKRVLAVDLDPQANLTASFLDEEELEWVLSTDHISTIYTALLPLKKGIGDVANPSIKEVSNNLCLLPGDLSLSSFEDDLSEVWSKCLDGDERAFRVTSAFWRVIQKAARQCSADLVLVDLGPNLGAINRAAMISSDFVVVPLSPDLYSLQGLKNLGPTLRGWRKQWKARLESNPNESLTLPAGNMEPIGYVILQHSVRLDRPVKAYDRWLARIPETYAQMVQSANPASTNAMDDPNCIGFLKHYRSLMPMAQEARKPLFELRAADGAIGAHARAVQAAKKDFENIASKILLKIGDSTSS